MRPVTYLSMSWFRNYEDVYSDPGSPLTRRTAWGTYVLAKVDGQRKLLLEVRGMMAGG